MNSLSFRPLLVDYYIRTESGRTRLKKKQHRFEYTSCLEAASHVLKRGKRHQQQKQLQQQAVVLKKCDS